MDMKSAFLLALAKLLEQFVPRGLRWLVDAFLKRTADYIDANPASVGNLDTFSRVARGEAEGDLSEAPDALKEWLRALFDKIAQSIKRPILRAAFTTVAGFVVDKLADLLWDELFGASSVRPGGIVSPARVPSHADVSAWQHSLENAARGARPLMSAKSPVAASPVVAKTDSDAAAPPAADPDKPPEL